MAQIINHTKVCYEELLEESAVLVVSPAYKEDQIAQLEKEAYQLGYYQGQSATQNLAQQEMNDLKTQLTQLLKSIPVAIEEKRLDMQHELAPIIWQIVQGYFVEQALNQQLLATQINQLLIQINKQECIELHLHPKDIGALKKGHIQLHTIHEQITIKQDEAMSLGGFIIKTEHGIFNASLEQQINNLKTYLLDKNQEVGL